MIRLEHILTPARSQVNVPGGSKKRVLEYIAHLIATDSPDIDEDVLFESLVAREKLGSTGFGNGIAIPHCRLVGCLTPISAIIHLETAVDFDAIDSEPVDLLFVLLVPEEATDEHLELLRQIASIFEQDDVLERLRNAPDSAALYQAVLDAQL
ncbi:PTS IIA-like nitrogen regulatory protein PtsN [Denitrificimonas sp. JX-1]|uniref:PTS IIA-like nitrogen regulatory protein PtsN n=1 Tax=Denitrificimonas halotolerans TaxID=3098930 RepID=A0ABU5GNZ9_9GAMM|nr:PTS IIA-like nitrogen regulatory protein PtsN [Denitrificimonas sp. JX-1]MDY7218262.1 PTS IIA-like nitrogen regulatory protein PtsN [Denitrificimonas sp. JX-1]